MAINALDSFYLILLFEFFCCCFYFYVFLRSLKLTNANNGRFTRNAIVLTRKVSSENYTRSFNMRVMLDVLLLFILILFFFNFLCFYLLLMKT